MNPLEKILTWTKEKVADVKYSIEEIKLQESAYDNFYNLNFNESYKQFEDLIKRDPKDKYSMGGYAMSKIEIELSKSRKIDSENIFKNINDDIVSESIRILEKSKGKKIGYKKWDASIHFYSAVARYIFLKKFIDNNHSAPSGDNKGYVKDIKTLIRLDMEYASILGGKIYDKVKNQMWDNLNLIQESNNYFIENPLFSQN